MARKRVAVLPGDDAAPEAVYPTLELLESLGLDIEYVLMPDGEQMATMPFPEREQLVRDTVDSCDSVLFGATSGKTGGVWYLRWGKETFANVRPVRWRPGVPSPLRQPEGIDYVIVRENIEDLYLGLEGSLDDLRASGLDLRPFRGLVDLALRHGPATGAEGRYAVKVITKEGTRRVARFAFELARKRKSEGHPGTVTTAVKWNVLPQSDGFFRQTVQEVAAEYPDIGFDDYLADDFARRLVASPQDFDVVVLPNLYGDLFSDEGAATVGGLGMCPSGCYGADYAYFEPVHGTAPDIAGRHAINPLATILSAAMMLEHLGFAEAARRVEHAVDAALRAGDCLTPDLGGTATTDAFAKSVQARL